MKNKVKSHRATAKRVRVTKNGKVVAHRAFKSHLLSSKNRKRKRHLRKQATLSPSAVRNIHRILPYA